MQCTCHAIRLIFLAFGLGISSWAPLVPIIKTRFELDDAELGLVLFVFGIGALFMMPLTGWMIHKVGSRLITFLSGLAVTALLPILAIVPTTLSLCIVLFLFGVATGAMNVSMNSQSVGIEIAYGSPILSGIHCWFSLGGLLGALVVSSLLSVKFPLLYCMLTVSGIILLILITQWHHLLPYNRNLKPHQMAAQRFTLFNTQALILGGFCFIIFMAEGSVLDWSAEYLRSDLNYDTSAAGIGYAIFSIAMAAGRYVGDRIIHRFGTIKVFKIGSLIAAAGFLIVVTPLCGYSELFGFCLIGLGASNIVPILFSSSGKLSEISSSNALTIVTTCGYIGLLLGPAFIGFLAQSTNLSFALATIAFLLIAIGIYGRFAIQRNQ